MSGAVIEPAVLEVVSTATTSPTNRFEQWEHHVQETCGTLQVLYDRDRFACGRIVTATLADLHVSVISADPHTVVRQPRATGGEPGHVYVTTPLRGFAMVSQDDHQVAVPPGEIVTFDSSRPYTLTMPEPFRMVAVRAQHHSLGLTPDSTRRLKTNSWSSQTGIGALASRTLAALGQHLTEFDEASFEPLGSAVASLVTTLFTERLHFADDPRLDRRTLMASICRTARECLADSELNPAMLARRHSISLRSLQMLFAEHGTSPARWIRDERLHRVRADLANPRLAHLTVAMIGERWGLVDASQVSRLFRAKYGVSPSQYRKNPAAART
ncbi:helix-turn-helix domain-containing protein [Actinophytocola sp.]|uniref:AraC-like ligand-binding domain-containing protein n=1 Tax=Actinophytocola sp. TaxID=1872138 RepID=UPI003D6AB411